MARFEFKLPDIGEGVAEAEIVAWHVKPGDKVEEDQPLADVMTDKATVAMEAPVSGRVVELGGAAGDLIAIGSVLAVIETASDTEEEVPLADGAVQPTEAMEERLPVTEVEQASSVSPAPAARRVEEPPAKLEERVSTAFDTNGSEKKPLASPAVRKRARELGIDLGQVKAAGERIRHSDLDAYLLYHGGGINHRAEKGHGDETIKVTGLRRRIAERMAESKRRIPHFTLVEEFDVTALEETRAMLNRDRAESDPKLTLLPFLITAMARSAEQWPMLNATYDDENQTITRHGAMHAGVATQTDAGLMVPVIRDAGSLTLTELANEIARLSEAARSGKASREDLSGSTMTVSSLGPLGGIASTPVINAPEVAIIAVNKIEEKPVIADGEIVVRKRMNLSLSCDHRVVDGWDAANYLAAMKALIENPLRLLSS